MGSKCLLKLPQDNLKEEQISWLGRRGIDKRDASLQRLDLEGEALWTNNRIYYQRLLGLWEEEMLSLTRRSGYTCAVRAVFCRWSSPDSWLAFMFLHLIPSVESRIHGD